LIRNNKGNFYVAVVGMAIVLIAFVGYTIAYPMFEGPTGLFHYGNNTLNLTDNTTRTIYDNTTTSWRYFFLGLGLSGLGMIVFSAVRKEYDERTTAPYMY
jgi:hypothetical protein